MTGQSQAQNRSHSSSSSFMNSPFTQTPQPSPQVHTQFQSAYPSSIFPQPQNFQFQQHPSQPPPPQYQPPPQPLPLDLQSQHSQVSTIRASEHLERQSGEYTFLLVPRSWQIDFNWFASANTSQKYRRTSDFFMEASDVFSHKDCRKTIFQCLNVKLWEL